MKIHQQQIFIHITTALLLSTSITQVATASPVSGMEIRSQFRTQRVKLQNQNNSQLTSQFAQLDSGDCQKVLARSGLYVRQEPTVYSTAIGAIDYGRNVTVQAGGNQRWTRISAPLSGYVWTNWLGPCNSAAYVPPQNCRLVTAEAPVRQTPSTAGEVLGEVASGRRVTIVNRGASGWVPISAPIEGYISASYLTDCFAPFKNR